MSKTCAQCAHAYADPKKPQYRRCRKSDAAETADDSLAGEMRKVACGPDATLWEPKNG